MSLAALEGFQPGCMTESVVTRRCPPVKRVLEPATTVKDWAATVPSLMQWAAVTARVVEIREAPQTEVKIHRIWITRPS